MKKFHKNKPFQDFESIPDLDEIYVIEKEGSVSARIGLKMDEVLYIAIPRKWELKNIEPKFHKDRGPKGDKPIYSFLRDTVDYDLYERKGGAPNSESILFEIHYKVNH